MDLRMVLEKYHMVRQGDLVIAAVSGGADSVCMLRLLLEASRKMEFALAAVHVEHGIRGEESLADMRFTQALCEKLGVPLRVCHVDVPGYAAEHGLGYEEAARQLRYEVFDRTVEEVLDGAWIVPGNGRTECMSGDKAVHDTFDSTEKGIRYWTSGQIHVALAHHQQDQAETVLFRLARGTGTEGLAGMRPVSSREVRERSTMDYGRMNKAYDIIRPMLYMSRTEIEDFLEEWGQAYCMDVTNQDPSYARNRLRLRVLPELTKVNAHAAEHIAQAAELLGQQQDYMAQEAAKALARIGQTKGTKEQPEIRLEIPALMELHPALQKEVLRQALMKVTKQRKDLTAGHVEQLLALTQKQSGSRLSLPYGVEAVREFSWIRICRPGQFHKRGCPDPYQTGLCQKLSDDAGEVSGLPEDHVIEICEKQLQQLLADGKPLEIVLGAEETLQICVLPVNNLSEIRKKKYTKCFDYDMIKEGFSIRRRREGDYLRMSSGHRKKLKQYLTEEKIPAAERQQLWLLAQDSCVIWVIGGRTGAGCEMTESSRYAVCMTYKKTVDSD